MDELIGKLKKNIRVKSEDADEEIKDLVESCKKDMVRVGIYGNETDPLYRQAIRLYCKGNYGYDDNAERFQKAYESLRDSMSLSGDYKQGGKADGGSNADLGGTR